MDIRQFIDRMNTLYLERKQQTNLKLLRKNANLTQQMLSQLSGISLRTIQQYEQRKKDINNAAAEKLTALASVLHCQMEDLMEKTE